MARLSIGNCVALTGLALGLLTNVAHAEIKVAVVNVPQLLEESPQAKAVSQALKDEAGIRQRDLANAQKDVKAKEDKLERDGAVMAESERGVAEKELLQAKRELQRKQNEANEDLNMKRNEEIGKLQRTLLREVQTYARGAGYDVVLGDGVLYASDAVNITAQVLAALQSRAKTGAAAPPAAKPATPAAKP